jgi:hypothetical protein
MQLGPFGRHRHPDRPRGFVLIQIDALAWRTLLLAMRRRRAPFLMRLLRSRRHGQHVVSPVRPGVPATTPAIQAEVMYGRPKLFPGFRFLDRRTGKEVYFGNAFDAARLEENELAGRFGILANSGSSYFNIFSGGASRSSFTTTGIGRRALWRDRALRAAQLPHLLLAWALALPRIAWRLAVEVALELFDIARGWLRSERSRGEFSVVLRGLLNTFLDQLAITAVRGEIAAGTRYLFVNFIAYDKASHLRGPEHPYALWNLRQIDRRVRQIWRAARRGRRTRYDVYVWSDHGTFPARPISRDAGKPFEAWLAERLARAGSRAAPPRIVATSNLAHLYAGAPAAADVDRAGGADGAPREVRRRSWEALQRELPELERVLDASPYVAWWAGLSDSGALVVRRGGVTLRPEEASGAGFDARLIADLSALLGNDGAGDLALFGARQDGLVWSFWDEYGGHGGAEPEEQDAFVIHPPGLNPEKRCLAPIDIFRHLRATYHEREPAARALEVVAP